MIAQGVLWTIVEGWTEPLKAQLLLDRTAFNASGMSIVGVTKNHAGQSVLLATAWDDATQSIVAVSPTAGQLLAAGSPYTIHFQVTDGDGHVVFFPAGFANQILVNTP